MPETQKWKESDTLPPTGTKSGSAGRRGEFGDDYSAEISHLKSELAKLSDAVSGSVKDAMGPVTRQLESAVVRNPTTSVLVAAGVGLLLGLMSTRR